MGTTDHLALGQSVELTDSATNGSGGVQGVRLEWQKEQGYDPTYDQTDLSYLTTRAPKFDLFTAVVTPGGDPGTIDVGGSSLYSNVSNFVQTLLSGNLLSAALLGQVQAEAEEASSVPNLDELARQGPLEWRNRDVGKNSPPSIDYGIPDHVLRALGQLGNSDSPRIPDSDEHPSIRAKETPHLSGAQQDALQKLDDFGSLAKQKIRGRITDEQDALLGELGKELGLDERGLDRLTGPLSGRDLVQSLNIATAYALKYGVAKIDPRGPGKYDILQAALDVLDGYQEALRQRNANSNASQNLVLRQ